MVLRGKAKLTEIVFARKLLRRLAARFDGRHQRGYEDPKNRDDDQQFENRKMRGDCESVELAS